MKVVLLLTLLFASSAQAVTKVVSGSIDRILTDGSLYGGCMVLLQPEQPLSAYGLNCRNNYLTFDCRGDAGQPGGRAQAELNLQQAQLAMALNATVQLVVTDSVTINENCYSRRVVVLRPSE
jgi:hypothetical protein